MYKEKGEQQLYSSCRFLIGKSIKSMNKKSTILFIIVSIAILGFIFYWFQFRPSTISRACYSEALSDIEGTSDHFEQGIIAAKYSPELRKEFIDSKYEECLKRKGIF